MLPLLSLALSCTPQQDALTPTELRDPESCAECHQDHVQEWRGSRHALASTSPMFQALSAAAEQDLGSRDLCLGCHGPFIVAEHEGESGLDLDSFDESTRGITCYFCHSIDGIEELHNNGLVLADDGVMRGGFDQPLATPAHESAYSSYQDRRSPDSSAACGSCHDVMLADGVFFERTYQEWSETLFAEEGAPWALGCNDCHMDGTEGVTAQVEGAPTRRVHSHMWPAVDMPLQENTETDVQVAAVQELLQTTLWAELCVVLYDGGALATVTLENLSAGHGFPSGAAQDRRVWVQVRATKDGKPLYESGVVPADQAVGSIDDPDLWVMQNHLYDADGNETHVLWDAVSYEGVVLNGATAVDPNDPDYVDTHAWKTYGLGSTVPDEVTVDVFMRPMTFDIIDHMIDRGTLDASMRKAWPTWQVLPQTLVWTSDMGEDCVE